MAILTTAITTFIVLVLIGLIVGLFFNRGGRGWLGRQVAGVTGLGDATYALVGIAGSLHGLPHRRHSGIAAKLSSLHRGDRGSLLDAYRLAPSLNATGNDPPNIPFPTQEPGQLPPLPPEPKEPPQPAPIPIDDPKPEPKPGP